MKTVSRIIHDDNNRNIVKPRIKRDYIGTLKLSNGSRSILIENIISLLGYFHIFEPQWTKSLLLVKV